MVSLVPVVVPAPAGGQQQITRIPVYSFTVDRGVCRGALDDEAESTGRVSVRLRRLAGKDDLDPGEQAVHSARIQHAGVDQHQHPSLCLVERQRAGEVQHQRPQGGIVPPMRQGDAAWFWR